MNCVLLHNVDESDKRVDDIDVKDILDEKITQEIVEPLISPEDAMTDEEIDLWILRGFVVQSTCQDCGILNK